MAVQGIATTLLLPPLLLVLLSLAAALAVIGVRGRGRAVLSGLIIFCTLAQLALATPFVAGHLAASLERGAQGAGIGRREPGAVIVLGADAARSPDAVDVGPLTLERLRAGAALARRTGLPLLVTAGPLSRGEPPLALAMAEVLAVDFGLVPRWIEPRAADTRENAVNAAAILKRERIEAAHIVTHAWHMPRALDAFSRAGLAVLPAAVRNERIPSGILSDFIPRTDHLHRSWLMIREWVGILVYRLRDGGDGERQ